MGANGFYPMENISFVSNLVILFQSSFSPINTHTCACMHVCVCVCIHVCVYHRVGSLINDLSKSLVHACCIFVEELCFSHFRYLISKLSWADLLSPAPSLCPGHTAPAGESVREAPDLGWGGEELRLCTGPLTSAEDP